MNRIFVAKSQNELVIIVIRHNIGIEVDPTSIGSSQFWISKNFPINLSIR